MGPLRTVSVSMYIADLIWANITPFIVSCPGRHQVRVKFNNEILQILVRNANTQYKI